MAMHVVPEISMHRDGRPCLISCLLLAQWCTNRQNFNKLLILDHATHTQPNQQAFGKARDAWIHLEKSPVPLTLRSWDPYKFSLKTI